MDIEKEVPAPDVTGRKGPPRKYPFADMEIGDSVFVEGENSQGRAALAARAHGNFKQKKFAARTQEGGVRIWRVA